MLLSEEEVVEFGDGEGSAFDAAEAVLGVAGDFIGIGGDWDDGTMVIGIGAKKTPERLRKAYTKFIELP